MSIFLRADGITGESSDRNHPGWIDIFTLEWSLQRNITAASSTRNDRESSNARFLEMELTRFMDAATPQLMLEACCGRGRTLEIHLTKTGSGTGGDTFAAYLLKNALISHYEVKAAAQHVIRPIERLRISFTTLELRYTPFDQDGRALAPISTGFDTTTNQKL